MLVKVWYRAVDGWVIDDVVVSENSWGYSEAHRLNTTLNPELHTEYSSCRRQARGSCTALSRLGKTVMLSFLCKCGP